MSDGMHVRRGTVRALGARTTLAAIALLVTLGLVAGRAPRALAQDDATPSSGECVALDGAGSAAEGTPSASPVAVPDVAAAATPVDDEEVGDAAVAAVENFAACWNGGDFEAVPTLITANLLLDKFGFASTEDAFEALETLGGVDALPAIVVVEVGDVNTYEDGRASLDFSYTFGDFQLIAARWYMVFEGDALLIDEEQLLLPQPDVEFLAALSAAIADDATPLAFTGASTNPVTEAVLINLANNATDQRVITAVRLSAEGEAALAAGVPGEGTPEAEATPAVAADVLADATFVGQTALAAGENADMALVGLEAGTYALLDAATPDTVVTFVLTEPVAVEVPVASPEASPAS